MFAKDKKGRSPLHWAAKCQFSDTVKVNKDGQYVRKIPSFHDWGSTFNKYYPLKYGIIQSI